MPGREAPRLPYQPALDGVRAFAVLAVMAVHELNWFPGGFYGVDAFFVLSGFLITSLLVGEWGSSGGIALGRFWARRARRLLPALFALVFVVGVVAAVWPLVLGAPNLLGNGVATLLYSANWYLMAGHSGYFAAVAQPSPLLHTWSLAIEEQFYLVWPLVVLAVLRPWGRSSRRQPAHARTPVRRHERRLEILFAVSVLGALASAVLMAVVSPTNGTVSNHAYYGTDTRLQGMLVGAALATGFTRWGHLFGTGSRRSFGALAVAGAALSVGLWLRVPETSALAFHGGFLLAALGTAAVVAGVVQAPAGAVARALGVAPLRWLGRISYGVYLWYWPVLLVVDGARTHLSGPALFAVRLPVTVGIAAASYYVVERPVRRGALPRGRAVVAAPVAAGVAAVAVLAASLVPAASAAPAPPATARAAPASLFSSRAPAVGAAAGALTAPGRLRVLLVGDSVAGSLGVGLAEVAARDGVDLVNEGAPGCSLAMDQQFRVLDYTVAPGPPCRAGDPAALLAQWRAWVDAFNPDVVLYLARGELFDQEVDGAWTNLTVPSFARTVGARIRAATGVRGARGAAVVLLTTPPYDSGEQGSGSPWPEDAPARVAVDNALLRQTAAAADRRPGDPGGAGRVAPGPVSVFDLAALMAPGDRFTAEVGGVTARCSDGVHFTTAAGEWLAPKLLPMLQALGRAHHLAWPAGQWPGAAPPVVPSWWRQLDCP